MNRTNTEDLIQATAMWSSLVVYFVVWVCSLGEAGAYGQGPAFVVAAIYVAMHVYEITRRHHCYLSADFTAFPVTLVCSGALLQEWLPKRISF